MEEKKDKYTLSPEDVQKLKMDPPAAAWSLLETELDKKQSLMNNGIPKGFQFAFMGIVVLTMFLLAYSYRIPVTVSMLPGPSAEKEAMTLNKDNNIGRARENKKDATSPILNGNIGIIDKSSMNVTVATKKKEKVPLVVQNAIANKQHPKKSFTAKEEIKGISPVNKENASTVVENSNNEKRAAQQAHPATESIAKQTNEKETISAGATTSESAVTKPDAEENGITDNTKKDSLQESTVKTPVQKEEKGSRFSIAAYYSPNYTRNHLTNNEDESTESISEYREHEKGQYAFSMGMSLGFDLSPHWSVSIGGIYSTLAYSIDLPVIYAGANDNNEVRYRYPTSCGIIEIPNQSQTSLKTGDSLKLTGDCSQLIRFVTIPLTVKYQVPAGRFTLYIYTGVSANFLVESRATLRLDPASTATETTIVNHLDGVKNMNYGYLFGVGARYNFYNGMGIFIEPAYRGSINSLTENLSVYCYPYSFGLNTGLSLRF